MATSNENITDALIRHRIGVLRFGNNLTAQIIGLLNRAEPELRRQLVRRLEAITQRGFDLGPRTTRQLIRLQAVLNDLTADTYKSINSTVRQELLGLASREVQFGAGVLQSAVPVVLDPIIPSARTLRSVVTSRPVNGRILREWLNSFAAADRTRLMEQMRIGTVFNETPTQIARRMFGTQRLQGADGARQLTRRGAQALAQTLTSAVMNNSLAQLYTENANILNGELYVATLDSRTTAICGSLDGKRYEVGKGPRPPLHINCRSVRVPLVDGRRLGKRPATTATQRNLKGLTGPRRRRRIEQLTGQVPARTTYDAWLRRQSAAFQNEVLGPTRGALYRRGGVTLDRFTDPSGRQLTLDELFDAERSAFSRANLPEPA